MKRRQLLTRISAALVCRQFPAWAVDTSMPAEPVGVKAHLDLAKATKIRAQFLANQAQQANDEGLGGEELDLSAYSSASLAALACLRPLNGSFATLGFETITPEMARVLSDWKTYFLCFGRLQNLEQEAACYLGNAENAHGLDFAWPMALTAATAKAVAGNGAPLHLALQAAPDLPCAKALAAHTHELYLTWPDGNIEPSVARALSLHAGYLLQLTMSNRPLQALL